MTAVVLLFVLLSLCSRFAHAFFTGSLWENRPASMNPATDEYMPVCDAERHISITLKGTSRAATQNRYKGRHGLRADEVVYFV